MKKLFIICFISFLILTCFASCNSVGSIPPQSTETSTETQPITEFCPLSYDEFMQKIFEDMTEEEVFAVVGRPQRIEMRELPIHPLCSSTGPTNCSIYDFQNDNRSIGLVYGWHDKLEGPPIVLSIHILYDSQEETT